MTLTLTNTLVLVAQYNFLIEMTQSYTPSINDIIALVAEIVPDIPEPNEIMAEIEGKDRLLWLEGW
ncbi:MAG: hypothetical protein ACW99U_04390 [Candidatus Thorarchaeota archaeon]